MYVIHRKGKQTRLFTTSLRKYRDTIFVPGNDTTTTRCAVWFGPTGATPALDLSVDVLFFCRSMRSPCLVQSCECVHNNFTSECRLNQKQCRFYPGFARFDSFGSSLAGSQNPAEPGAKHLVTFFIIKERSELRAH